MIDLPLFALRHGQVSGVESAMFNLMRGFHRLGVPLRVAYSQPSNIAPNILRWLADNDVHATRYPSFGRRMSARFPEEALFGLCRKADQVLFPNYHLPPATPRIRNTSVIIHDLQHKVLPQYFGKDKVRWLDLQFSRTLSKADRILFISHFELEQAISVYGSHFRDRACVVYNPVDWERFHARRPEATHQQHRYILSVAHQYPHKRLELLIRAFGILARQERDLQLFLVGRATPPLEQLARGELGDELVDRVHFTGFVGDEELGRLYREASLFALPSLYEGFGMPAVEAIGLGKAALVADAAAVREITMGFANYLPTSAGAEDWASALRQLLRDGSGPAPNEVQAIRERYNPLAIAERVRTALEA